jgi:CRP-like cAMP-binding protein
MQSLPPLGQWEALMPRSPRNIISGNRLLDALPSNVRERLSLETVALAPNQTIHEPGAIGEYVFFPTSGLISMIASVGNGLSVEIGMVGKEGMFNVASILGDERPSHGAMVQLPGTALRTTSAALRREAQAHPALLGLLLRYSQMILTTAAQTAACNRLHLLEQRCARWLLSAHDRAEVDTFPMTQEFLAMMLGVRRPGVTIAAQAFEADGLITYNHGTLTIVDRLGLEASSCACYRFIQDEFTRLLAPRR